MQDIHDVNYSLICAVRKGELERTKELINSFGLSYSKGWSEGYVLLRDALLRRHIEIAKLLLNYGCKVNSKSIRPSDTPLHLAVNSRDAQVVEMILDRGAEINAKNKLGKTPLYCLIKSGDENGSTEVVRLLLDQGANVNGSGEFSKTPLHIAVEQGNQTVVQLLLQYGAKVDNQDQKGKTALHLAVERGRLTIIENILKYCQNINNQCNRDSLKIAVLLNLSKQVVETLLEYGFSLNREDANNTELLHAAVEKGHVKIVEDLLKYGADVNALLGRSRYGKGLTPLHITVINKHEEVADLLISNEADINARDENGKTPMFYAIENSDLNLTKLLLANKASVKGANNTKLLHAAVEKGHVKIVEDLLKYGADVNALLGRSRYRIGLTPLHIAVENKHEEVAHLLISNEADINARDENGKTPIFYAIKNSDLNLTKLLLANKANVKDSPEVLFKAVEKKCIEIVEILLRYDVDVNASDKYGRTSLHLIAEQNSAGFVRKCFFCNRKGYEIYEHPEVTDAITKLLLNRGTDVDAQTLSGETALHFAIQNKNVKVVETILEYNANVNLTNDGISALHIATQKKYGYIIELLLKYGAKVNCKDNDGKTALIYAFHGKYTCCSDNHRYIIELLLKYGAKVNCKDNDGKTALIYACYCKYTCCSDNQRYIIELLLKYGAKVNCKDDDGKTALIYACYNPRYIIELLLKYGAKVNSRDNDGRTALHYACFNGHLKAVEELLEHGSDINITSKNGCTALDDNDDSDYFDNDDFDSDRGKLIAKLIVCHITKMKTANLYVSEKNIQSISEIRWKSNFLDKKESILQDKCVSELTIMKRENIVNCNISFYDILVKGATLLAAYMRNDNVVEVSKTGNYETQFPIYGSMLKNHFRKGGERNELLGPATRCFDSLFHVYTELPYECDEKILSFLSNEDLKNLIDAFEPNCIS